MKRPGLEWLADGCEQSDADTVMLQGFHWNNHQTNKQTNPKKDDLEPFGGQKMLITKFESKRNFVITN